MPAGSWAETPPPAADARRTVLADLGSVAVLRRFAVCSVVRSGPPHGPEVAGHWLNRSTTSV